MSVGSHTECTENEGLLGISIADLIKMMDDNLRQFGDVCTTSPEPGFISCKAAEIMEGVRSLSRTQCSNFSSVSVLWRLLFHFSSLKMD